MGINRTSLTGLLVIYLMQVTVRSYSAEIVDETTHLRELVIQAITNKSLEQKSTSFKTVPGDQAAKRAKQVGERLVGLSGKNIQVRIVEGLSNPISLASGEILIPAATKNHYTEGELNFIFAHELAHIELQHIYTAVRLAAQDCMTNSNNVELFVRQLGECIRKNLDEADELASVLQRLKWRQEHESDLWAVRFLSKHGLANDYRSLLEKFKNAEGVGLSATHPPASQRLSTIEQLLGVTVDKNPR